MQSSSPSPLSQNQWGALGAVGGLEERLANCSRGAGSRPPQNQVLEAMGTGGRDAGPNFVHFWVAGCWQVGSVGILEGLSSMGTT